MKMNLLELTQNILLALRHDEVNTIGETQASQEVSQIIKETYYNLINDIDMKATHKTLALEALSDLTKPSVMKLPDKVREIQFLKYNIGTVETPKYSDLTYLEPSEFLERQLSLDTSQSNISFMDLIDEEPNLKLPIKTDKAPEYYTTFDNKYLIFDGYDSEVDSTLQAAKMYCYGGIEPSWSEEDTFVPVLDPDQFSLLLESAKQTCFVVLAQTSNPISVERIDRARRKIDYKGRRLLAQKKDFRPNYGRRRP